MNALVTFRANSAGTLAASPEKREEAWQQVTSLLRAKLTALQKAAAKTSATSGSSTSAAKAAAAKAATSAKAAKASDGKTQSYELDKDSFLQLLVMEMQNQNPMEPMDNSQMIAQLAQFSSLEQMTNLNDSFKDLQTTMEYLTGNVDQLNFISAQGMLGKWVKGINVNGTISSGLVESVTLDGSIVVLTVDGKFMPMTGVLSVASEAPVAPPPEGDTTPAEK